MKTKFLPYDYQLELLKKLQNLKQIELSVKAYKEEFYKMSIKSSHNELDHEKLARYVNGLRLNIQDELNMIRLRNVEEEYQYDLKTKDKLARKQGTNKGRGGLNKGKVHQQKNYNHGKEASPSKSQKEKDETISRPYHMKSRSGYGRSIGRGFQGTFFNYG
jgi:hypothetical protein